MSTPVFRFAPSPNGALHLGHALSAFVTHDMAAKMEARFLLRIEDIDLARCRPEFEAQMLADLAWLGEASGLLYPCFATRKEIAGHAIPGQNDHDGAPLYPALHKAMPEDEVRRRKDRGEAFALRIDMEKAVRKARAMTTGPLTFTELDPVSFETKTIPADPARWGDAVIARKDVPTSYHLSVVVDDALQNITHVTRGRDLYAATDIHRLLQVLLELPAPLYHHHRLLMGGDGRKLSKSHKDRSLASLREEGAGPEDIRRLAGLA
ncbi:MAG: glutamate--tRNA ligase family protein [Alphaproteobacteria bacterium]